MERFVREKEVAYRSGLSRTTRWRLEKEGKFPSKRDIADSAKALLDSEFSEWIATRPITKSETT